MTMERKVRIFASHADAEEAFRWACKNGHLAVVRELLALDGYRRIPTAVVRAMLRELDNEEEQSKKIAALVVGTRLELWRARRNYRRLLMELSLTPGGGAFPGGWDFRRVLESDRWQTQSD